MSSIEIKIEDSKIKVNAPYDRKFVDKAHSLHGKWSKPYWVFAAEDETEVRNACFDIYGDNGKPQETVTLLIDIEEYEDSGWYLDNEFRLANRLLATRVSRDSAVKLGSGVILQKGEFSESGGSRNNPNLGKIEGITLKVKNFPKAIYEALEKKDGITIAEDAGSKRAELEAEKKKLLERLAAIEEELKKVTE